MQHVMFDIDGTLVLSEDFDGDCYLEAVHEVVGYPLSDEWERYLHVTDSGILDQHVDELGLDTERARLHAEVKAAFVGKIADPIEGARLKLSGTVFSEQLGYKLVTGYKRRLDSPVILIDAFGTYTFGNDWRVRWGQYKPMLLREQNVSSSKQLAVERSVTNFTFCPGSGAPAGTMS